MAEQVNSFMWMSVSQARVGACVLAALGQRARGELAEAAQISGIIARGIDQQTTQSGPATGEPKGICRARCDPKRLTSIHKDTIGSRRSPSYSHPRPSSRYRRNRRRSCPNRCRPRSGSPSPNGANRRPSPDATIQADRRRPSPHAIPGSTRYAIRRLQRPTRDVRQCPIQDGRQCPIRDAKRRRWPLCEIQHHLQHRRFRHRRCGIR